MTLKKKTLIVLGIALTTLFATKTNAQEQTTAAKISPFLKMNKDKAFSPIVSIETWAYSSLGKEDDGTEYKGRTDVAFRRFRFGAKGNPYSWLKYSFQLHMDAFGKDDNSAVKGSPKDGIQIWNAYITAKLLKSSEFLNIEAGYFWAAISRESDTSPWAVSAFDKTRSSWFLRRFNTGVGNGIVSGIALAGIKNTDNFGFSYRIGSYEPDLYASSEYASRLYTGRFMFSFGSPEQKKYKYMLSGNQWGKRTGVTIGFGAATQSNGYLSTITNDDLSTTDLYFKSSASYGADFVVDLKGLRIDGEYYKMKRKADGYDDFDGSEYRVCLAYNFIAGNKYLEPCVTYSKYEGEGAAKLLGSAFIGDDSALDIGINWYISKANLKMALHYIDQDGTCGKSKKGDVLGLSCQFKL